jgi:hypothetical protein
VTPATESTNAALSSRLPANDAVFMVNPIKIGGCRDPKHSG